jgi:hypothetical protein
MLLAPLDDWLLCAGSVLASSRLGPLLRSKKFLELFISFLGITPANGLAGNNVTSTLCEEFGIN